MTKSEAAFRFSADRLADLGKIYFWTFTFKDVLDLKETRKRWNHLLTLIRREWPKACGLRVFELHESHGLHVHLLTNKFIHVNVCRQMAKRSGWGRIHVVRITKDRTGYLAKYLSKDRPGGLKRWRLWAAFGTDWVWTKVAQVEIESLYATIYRALAECYAWKGNKSFKERSALVREMILRTMGNDWEPGLGPRGKPYSECLPHELLGTPPAKVRREHKNSAKPIQTSPQRGRRGSSGIAVGRRKGSA
jgi:hypothetical protein